MKPHEDDDLIKTLEQVRPEPRPEFVAELDARAAAGFPRKSRLRGFSLVALLDRLPELSTRKVLLPLGATALTALVLATVVVSQSSEQGTPSDVANTQEGTGDGPGALGFLNTYDGSGGESSEGGSGGEYTAASGEASAEEASSGPQYESESLVAPSASNAGAGQSADPLSGTVRDSGAASGVGRQQRAIERSSQITLGTAPENLGEAASEVFDVVHNYRGVVLRSQTSDGSAARAEADFELLIPSGRLGDAMAAFSRIGEVRSRNEATTDITAPTVSAAAHLEDSRARIDSLLGQLAAAETEGEREAVEGELRGERRRAAALQASLDRLERRASLSRVSLQIVGAEGAAGAGGAWGIGDALDDAGQVLGVAAAVALLTLAVLAPLALVALLIWLCRRTYLRRARRTALG